MDCETNIGSIRALDEQIGEYERTVIKLKRTRNSLLNISKLPPEVLGNVFRWNVTRKGDFGGLDKRSHNFLAVCHHWSEVALRTPELWSFWGNTTRDWARLCCYSRTTPLDLVLKGNDYRDYEDGLHSDLCDALNDRAAEDTIRRVHLDANLLVCDIIFELTPEGEELRSNGMESLVLWDRGSDGSADVSDFFARYRFPKLQRLELSNCVISSWDHLSSRTSILTTLELDFADLPRIPTPSPTTSQLLSMLASNPTLQRVVLLRRAIPNDDASESSSRVQLRHLKELRLGGNLQHVFKLLNQLDHPRNLDRLTLALHDCDVVDISRTIGPYLRDHLHRRDRSQDGLNLLVSYKDSNTTPYIKFRTGDARGIDFSAPSRAEINSFVRVNLTLSEAHHWSVLERVALDLTSCAPREEVVHFRVYKELGTGADAYTQFPNLRALSFYNIPLPTAFPTILIGERKIPPSLEHIFLEDMVVDDADWSPLVNFLAHRVSSGHRLDTLVIVRSNHMCLEVTESIRGMVRELRIGDEYRRCPFQRKCCT